MGHQQEEERRYMPKSEHAPGCIRDLEGACIQWKVHMADIQTLNITGPPKNKEAVAEGLLCMHAQVIAVSGTGGDEKSAEIYDPDTKEWTLTSALTAGHNNQVDCILPHSLSMDHPA